MSNHGNLGDYAAEKKAFMDLFNSLAREKHRYQIFNDFITMSAIALHNGVNKIEVLEQEYLSLINKYSPEDAQSICRLLAHLVMMEYKGVPYDVLGELFMDLELNSKNKGQFFTPFSLALAMTKMIYDPTLYEKQAFVSFSDPACGAGSLPLAMAACLIDDKKNPADVIFMQCVDIDRTVALMCYIQLSLWHIPAQVVVGDTLQMTSNEQWFTPAYYLNDWHSKLEFRYRCDALKRLLKQGEKVQDVEETKAGETVAVSDDTVKADADNEDVIPEASKTSPSSGVQLSLFDIEIPSSD